MPGEAQTAFPSFAVVVPMFNERAGAELCVEGITRVLNGLPNQTILIIVDDGSWDGTSVELKNLSSRHPVLHVVTHPINRGYGAALVSGSQYAAKKGFAYTLFMDSDLTNSPQDIPQFAASMATGADVIKASRYVPGGGMVGVPWRRAILSRIGNALARRLYRVPVRDCTNGFRAIRTTLLSRMDLRERGFAIIMEELYWCRFLTRSFVEIPVKLTTATRVSSFRYRPSVFMEYLRYPLRAFMALEPEDRKQQ
jgi:dolichol-phosphate mannosyltransferase